MRTPQNQKDELTQQLADMLYYGIHVGFRPRGQEQWVLEYEHFLHGADPDLLAHALFAESQTDGVHGVGPSGSVVCATAVLTSNAAIPLQSNTPGPGRAGSK